MNKAYTRINWKNEPSVSTPINETNLNKMDSALNEIDTRVVNFDTSKANETDVLQCFNSITYNTSTGVFIFTKKNGTTVEVDLNIEKIPVSFNMDANGIITMTTSDGTKYTADVASLIKLYTFIDSSVIDFTVTEDASGNKSITATIIDGSITEDKLQPNFLADCKAAKTAAETAKTAAEASSYDSEAYAVGKRKGVDVPTTDPAYHNNAKYFSDNFVGKFTDTQWEQIENII